MINFNERFKILGMSIFLPLFFSFYGVSGHGEILFEGYSKIVMGGQEIGFTIQRYEFDSMNKIFKSTGFIKYNELGGSMTESLTATSNEVFEPIQYTYKKVDSQGTKIVEGRNLEGKLKVITTETGKGKIDFSHLERDKPQSTQKGKMTVTTVEKESTRTIEKTLPKGTYFSTFLFYMMVKNPEPMKVGVQYKYKAIAEEDGSIYEGVTSIASDETYKGIHVFKAINDFKETQFISLITPKGEVLMTSSPKKALTQDLIPYTGNGIEFDLSNSVEEIKNLFSGLPAGGINVLATTNSIKPSKPESLKSLELQTPPKNQDSGKQGVRKGLDIQTKGK